MGWNARFDSYDHRNRGVPNLLEIIIDRRHPTVQRHRVREFTDLKGVATYRKRSQRMRRCVEPGR
jgi:hypothetical protein